MKHIAYTLVLFAFAAVSCSEQQYLVKGKSTQSTLDGEYAYMAPMTSSNQTFIDSCRVVHGKFEMIGPLDSIQCVTIYMGSMGIPMVLETGEVSINFQNSNIRVSGTPLNERFYTFLNTRDSLVFTQMELFNKIATMSLYKAINNDYAQDAENLKKVTEKIDSLECEFIRQNYDNVLGVSWFLRMCDEASANSGYFMIPDNLKAVYESAPKTFKLNREIQAYINMCDGEKYIRGHYYY